MIEPFTVDAVAQVERKHDADWRVAGADGIDLLPPAVVEEIEVIAHEAAHRTATVGHERVNADSFDACRKPRLPKRSTSQCGNRQDCRCERRPDHDGAR